ncbi:CaiB/BaiF CoA transferase family protein [Sediminivirga luteola]|uniref:CoA transferase n=1 Tax=Sediminivirga luteola TaxID=1774748 RepID=A0A8J2TY86_9MICO|nr:CoA transferase [Sediminivirga luteola]MCI2266483.1 CoA transferase [Sediminivirga luteola]GGA15065.1 CoA transferase [Sediminivirga luteola]
MSWLPESERPTTGPLAGVRVVELARIIAGPLAGLYLADMGAEVLKIERPGGDEMRHYGPERWDGTGSTFLALNRNKRSLVLDLNRPEARERLLEIVSGADVLVESYRPGVLERWNLTFEELRAVNPHLVMCSITGFGDVGPAASLGANNLIAEAFGGSLSVGLPETEHMLTGAPATDFFTGTSAALAVVAQLTVPRRDRRAVHVRTSLLESQALMMSGYIVGYLATGNDPDRTTGLPFTVPNQVFETADGRIVLAANSESMWRRLCLAVGREEWLDRSDYQTNALRMERQDEIIAELGRILAGRPRAGWLTAFQRAQVTAAPVNSVAELLDHPQFAALGLLQPSPEGYPPGTAGVRLPFTFDGGLPAPGRRRPAPRLDEAGDETSGDRQP